MAGRRVFATAHAHAHVYAVDGATGAVKWHTALYVVGLPGRIGDQTVWAAANGGPGALAVFAQLGVGDARVDQIGSDASGGITRMAPVAARPKDEAGLAVTAAFVGSHARRAAAAGTEAGAETTLEATYQAQLTSRFAAQPDVQYVIRPGALRTVRNAWVPGLRITVAH